MPQTAKIYLVRHAKAGHRDQWHGDDRARPLTPAGQVQAERLAETFSELPPARLLSSPFARCVETLQPTATRTGMRVELADTLAEDTPVEPVLELLATVPPDTVLCSHGDLIPSVLAALERRGMAIRTTPDWRKGSTWVLERQTDGQFTAASAWPPPAGQ